MKEPRPAECPRSHLVEHLGPPSIGELTRLDPSFNRVYRCGECSHVWSPATAIVPVASPVAV